MNLLKMKTTSDKPLLDDDLWVKSEGDRKLVLAQRRYVLNMLTYCDLEDIKGD